MNKQQLGQFFTVNRDYILKNLDKYVKSRYRRSPNSWENAQKIVKYKNERDI